MWLPPARCSVGRQSVPLCRAFRPYYQPRPPDSLMSREKSGREMAGNDDAGSRCDDAGNVLSPCQQAKFREIVQVMRDRRIDLPGVYDRPDADICQEILDRIIDGELVLDKLREEQRRVRCRL